MCFGGGDAPEPEESEAKLAMAEMAAVLRNRYQSTFVPLENMMIDEAMTSFDSANYDAPMGRAGTMAQSVYEPQIQQQQQQMLARGIDPSSGAFKTNSDALNQGLARARGEIAADAGMGVTDRGFQNLTNMVRIGQGLQGEAAEGYIDLAGNQLQALEAKAERDFSRSQSRQSAVGSVAGMGAGYGLNRGSVYG